MRGARSVSRAGAQTGAEGLVGHVGVVRQELQPVGQVFVDGASGTRGRGAFEEPGRFRAGDPVVVERVKGLTLSVRRAEEWELDL